MKIDVCSSGSFPRSPCSRFIIFFVLYINDLSWTNSFIFLFHIVFREIPSDLQSLLGLPYQGGVSSRTLVTIERQSDLLSLLRNSCAGVIPPPTTFASLSTSFPLGLLLPTIFPATQTFFTCWSLITYLIVISLLVTVQSNTSAFLTLSAHDIFSILLKKHISAASIFFCIALFIV